VFHGEQYGHAWEFVYDFSAVDVVISFISRLFLFTISEQRGTVMVRYALKQHIFLYDTYVIYGSAGKCRQKCQRKFRDERVPSRQTIHNLVHKLRTTELLIDRKQKHKRRVLTEEKLDDIGASLEHH
jgi:hypothetical protein